MLVCVYTTAWWLKSLSPHTHTHTHSNSLAEEKRRIENKMSTLEEDLEEEQMNSESAIDKARKAEQQADSLATENSQLQASLQKAEAAKSQFEKQVSSGFSVCCVWCMSVDPRV